MILKRAAALALLLLCLAAPLAAAQAVSPVTGLPSEGPYRPVLVQIGNSREARPAYGLAHADIVYETVYWGPRHTRYLALFAGEHPEAVGGLRSSRVFFAELREMWDCPYVFWGAAGYAGEGLRESQYFNEHQFFAAQETPQGMLFDATRAQPAAGALYYRAKDRLPPHNAMVSLRMLMDGLWPENEDGTPYEPARPGLVFSDTPSRGDVDALRVDVTYEAKDYAPSYRYDAASGLYDRWYDGAPQADADGTPVRAANVIVQYVWLSYPRGSLSLPRIETTGSGPADFFIDGTHIRGAWVRDGIREWTRFLDAGGKQIVLKPGKTFIQLVPMEMGITFADAQGGTHTLDAAASGARPDP